MKHLYLQIEGNVYSNRSLHETNSNEYTIRA